MLRAFQRRRPTLLHAESADVATDGQATVSSADPASDTSMWRCMRATLKRTLTPERRGYLPPAIREPSKGRSTGASRFSAFASLKTQGFNG
jgi:hypothetical protein